MAKLSVDNVVAFQEISYGQGKALFRATITSIELAMFNISGRSSPNFRKILIA
jgi:hypothetical protein